MREVDIFVDLCGPASEEDQFIDFFTILLSNID